MHKLRGPVKLKHCLYFVIFLTVLWITWLYLENSNVKAAVHSFHSLKVCMKVLLSQGRVIKKKKLN